MSENPQLTSEADREFDEDETEDSNSLGVYKLDKRLLIKANHLDEHFAPPIYNIWKQQERSKQVNHFGNSEPRCRGCCEAGFQRILTLLRPQQRPPTRSLILSERLCVSARR